MVKSALPDSYWTKQQIVHITDSQWGDTGKGKLVDFGAQYADVIVKTNGGANAGHTVRNSHGEFKLHLLPSGIFNPDAVCVVGANVVVDPLQLAAEYKEIIRAGITPAKCYVSDKATGVFVWHQVQDTLREKSKGIGKIGTTGRGIGPAYAERTARTSLRLQDFLRNDFENFFYEQYRKQERYTRFLTGELLFSEITKKSEKEIIHLQNTISSPLPDYEQIRKQLFDARAVIKPMITNTYALIQQAKEEGKRILGEAGQGALLDLNFGTVPYVTSSHPGILGFTLSTGISPQDIGKVLGSTKAYMTRVGEGPMPTELTDAVGERLREVGKEYGATTGRPRRCGWFDAVVTRYGIQTSGITDVALTKLDVLDEFDSIDVCVAYEVDSKVITELTDPDDLLIAKPVYKSLKGWMKDTSRIREYRDLPPEAKDYVIEIENLVGLPVSIVSVGPGREETIYRDAA